MKINNDNKCTFCNDEVETILHLFWECKFSQKLIKDVFSNIFNSPLTVDKNEFIFGNFLEKDETKNVLMLFTKKYIYSCKMHKSNLVYNAAKLYIAHQYKIHREVLKSVNGSNSLDENWIKSALAFNI